ncbi:hypothetical protein G6F55_007424 [Rhizopus delemar]|uniref:Glycosyltransferase family 49 protein n=2 Tax=Rhizopus TaxID=4842 RepID=A0A9P6YZP3_9FUNG|nr:hypothetical protein G6F55_007424 [Rhizopus delemar]KAG1523867.1 hypothetical protein G6F52_004663 [Rhizopus delemar]KAG1540045.1 hypothetical protein G6F51_008761 [Rhizopus arrhizus]KAG1567314.1 hypothetical protein G6F50_008324 [Rhizopus delemar]KAG1626585.1 hypothetical protein G6F45_008291 [Rhizopus arrhizus]
MTEVRPKHSRSTSITKNSTISHQRKPSLSAQQKSFIHNTNNPVTAAATLSNVNNENSKRHYHKPGLSSPSGVFNQLIFKVHSFLNPSGPLLPHSKHAAAFGGTSKPSLLTAFCQSRMTRFLTLFYVIFSVFLTLNHGWKYLMGTSSPSVHIETVELFDDNWVPQRTYDQDKPYSLLDSMTHGLKMHKLFSKSYYDAAKNIQPFWLKASNTPSNDQVSIITAVTAKTWPNLLRLTVYWDGPISAIVHLDSQDELSMERLEQEYREIPELYNNVDLHLVRVPGEKPSVLFPRNAERNLARLLSRTEYIMDVPSDMIPASDLRRTLEANKKKIKELLEAGDLLALPTFTFREKDVQKEDIPVDKGHLINNLHEGKMVLNDKHWKENEGPTDLDKWIDANTLYSIEKYEFHYEPVVIESKTVQPWCSERFLDSRAACIFSSYLQGNEIYVMPDDYVVQMPDNHAPEVSDFDHVVENRIYAKFYWEQCVHHARQLDALGLWNNPRSRHIRSQCSRVNQNWGKGLIGKPE